MEVEFLPLARFMSNRGPIATGGCRGASGSSVEAEMPFSSFGEGADSVHCVGFGTIFSVKDVRERESSLSPSVRKAVSKAWFTVNACVFTINASHHFAPCRSMTCGAAQHRSHQVASVRSDRAVLYLLRKTARLRCSSLAFARKLGSFQCFTPKRTVENFSPNRWVCYPSCSSFFCTSFVVFQVKTALLFLK